jgi:hypothetical protein
MKYLLSIFTILAAITVVTLFFIWPDQRNDDGEAVVTINGRTLTDHFFQQHRDRDQHLAENENFVETIVTRQLLIAEAQRRRIDQQPAFRLALKTLYENSLIDLLLKEVNNEIETTVSAEEITQYLKAFGKTYTFYLLPTQHPVSIKTIQTTGTKYISRFDELGSTLRQSLASMEPETATTTYANNKDKIAIYLESIEGETARYSDFDRGKIKNQLEKIKLEKQVSAWIENLRNQAAISYHINQE